MYAYSRPITPTYSVYPLQISHENYPQILHVYMYMMLLAYSLCQGRSHMDGCTRPRSDQCAGSRHTSHTQWSLARLSPHTNHRF